MQSEAKAKALEQFTDYFVKNYPGPDTIIYDPKWHAPKIFAAAHHAITAALSAEQTQPVAVKACGWVVIRKSGGGIFMSAERYDEASAAAEADIHDRGYYPVYRSALVDVPAEPEPSAFRVRVPGWGEELLFTKDGAKELIARIRSAKGVQGVATITPLYTSPPLSREGEDTAEVVEAGERFLKACDAYVDGEEIPDETLMVEYGDALEAFRAALAATRSGSATIAKGNDQ